MNNTDTHDRIIAILRALGRPGTDAVVNYLETSSYFKRGCYGHHKEHGGLAKRHIAMDAVMAAALSPWATATAPAHGSALIAKQRQTNDSSTS